MRWIAVSPLVCCACSLLFEPGLAAEDAGQEDGASPDADSTTPRVFAPELFPEHAPAPPYLFEGSGYRFADHLLAAPGTHEPLPLLIDRLQPGDVIALTVPSGFSWPWVVCGSELTAGETTLLSDLLAPPCLQGESMAAISVVVPVDPAYDSNGTLPTDLVIQTTRGSNVFETLVPVLPLAESVVAPSDNTLYASIRLVDPIVGTPGGPPIEWNAVSDISLSSSVNLNGANGEDSNSFACGLTGCAGGAGVAGGTSGGSSNCDGVNACAGAGSAAGAGVIGSCGGSSGAFYRSAGGGGGGNAVAGMAGDDGGNCFLTGGAGGEQSVAEDLLYLLDPEAAGGSGGGAGGAVTESPSLILYGGGGGGGGGSIGIHTSGQVFLQSGSSISATGGRGGSGGSGGGNSSKTSGRGGAGSGGAILIQAGDILGEAPLNVSGGGTVIAGGGGDGFIRLDGRNTSAALLPDALRGPDSDIASAISSDGQWLVRIYSAGGTSFTWGHRSAGDLSYVLEAGTSSGGALTLRPALEAGLHELCVFAVAPISALVTDIQATNKHCVWRAIVPQDL